MIKINSGVTLCFLILFTLSCRVFGGAVIYVNNSNTAGPWEGTEADPFQTIADGLDALAASNAVSRGGHTLIVLEGVYKEQITLLGPAIGGHSGVSGSPNRITTQGKVVIDGENTTRHGIFNSGGYCYYMHIDGFTITRCTWGVSADAMYHHSLSNLTIHSCRGGINLTSGNAALVGNINRCTIVGNDMAGVYSTCGGGMIVRNSIIAYNGVGAFEAGSTHIALQNTLLYGNGVQFLDEYSTIVDTREDIEALSNDPYPGVPNTGLETNCPGYISLRPFDPVRVRVGSPIFTADETGGCAGALSAGDYITQAVSSGDRVFYVAVVGDDGRDETTAQNQATPWATPGRAAESVRDGDTVLVSGGSYPGGFTVSNATPLGIPISFAADGGQVVVNGFGQTAAMALLGIDGIVFDGFSFTGATHGVTMEGVYQASFSNCYFLKNDEDGLNARNSSANIFSKCDFADNGYRGINLYGDQKASSHRFSFFDCNVYSNRPSNNAWGAVDARGAFFMTIDRCRIFDNNANNNYSCGIALSGYYYNVLGLAAGFNSIRNSAIYRNNQGIVFHYTGPDTVVDNCVISSSRYVGVSDSSSLAGNWGEVRNSVIHGNATYGYKGSLHSVIFRNSAFKDNTTAHYYKSAAPANTFNTAVEINTSANTNNANNIVPAMDIAFKDVASGDFRTRGGSPLIDAGTETTPWHFDINGNPRLVGSAVDIGCSEHPPAGTFFKFW